MERILSFYDRVVTRIEFGYRLRSTNVDLQGLSREEIARKAMIIFARASTQFFASAPAQAAGVALDSRESKLPPKILSCALLSSKSNMDTLYKAAVAAHAKNKNAPQIDYFRLACNVSGIFNLADRMSVLDEAQLISITTDGYKEYGTNRLQTERHTDFVYELINNERAKLGLDPVYDS